MKSLPKISLKFMVFILILNMGGWVYAADSTIVIRPSAIPQQLQPTTTTTQPTGTIRSVGRSGSPVLDCPEGYVLKAANVGESYFWNPKASISSYTWTCNNTCNNLYAGCGCPNSRGCPGGCFLGCPSDCESKSPNYTGAWQLSSNLLTSGSQEYQATSYTCAKVENVYRTPAP